MISLGPLSFTNVIDGTRSGLASKFRVKCTYYKYINDVATSAQHKAGSRSFCLNVIGTNNDFSVMTHNYNSI